MMKKFNIKHILSPLALVGICVCVPFCMSHESQDDNHSPKSEVPYCVASPSVPAQTEFAGETISLTRADMRERMDRELSAFTYMHSTTMLTIKRANRFFPVVEPILKEEGVPDDFKYLMTIESNLDMLARSPAKASGLWQFMEGTGRDYGLEVNTNVDERYHIEKATRAACRYLKDAYVKYGDWLTVAASYNAGQGRISQELNRQQVSKATDLWLVPETSRYMFRILAVKEVFKNPSRYGFLLKKENLYPIIPSKEVKVDTTITNLASFAKKYGLTVSQLKEANPWLREYSLHNKGRKVYTLSIPDSAALHYDPQKTQPYRKEWVIN
jgi:hypothetical protein